VHEDVLILTDERMARHDPGPGHPERPERLRAILRALAPDAPRLCAPREVRPEELRRVHTARHLEAVERLRGAGGALDPDTIASPDTVACAELAAGAAIEAAEAIMRGDARRAFAVVRPPGHHAEPDRAMGFCFYSNVALAAAHARAALGVERVMIADFDVHHGNGTQAAFEDRADVLFMSSHRYPFYPGTGAIDEIGTGPGRGFTVNVPLPAGAGDATVAPIYAALIPALAARFRPDLLLVSAGFDAHERDPLGGLRMTDDGFAILCAILRDAADAHAQGRIALVLEGGYDLRALAAGVRRCVEILAGADAPPVPSPDVRAARVLAAVHSVHARGLLSP
jgi:acetoin utilization deacetylase AcuC-like enzyme